MLRYFLHFVGLASTIIQEHVIAKYILSVIPKKMNKNYTISNYVLDCIFNVLIYAEVIAGKKSD